MHEPVDAVAERCVRQEEGLLVTLRRFVDDVVVGAESEVMSTEKWFEWHFNGGKVVLGRFRGMLKVERLSK